MHIVSQYYGITMVFVDTTITVIPWYFLLTYLMLYKVLTYFGILW